MNPTTIRSRIFVVGVPRSGTTLVQGLLAAHDQLTTFTESHFLSRHYTRVPGRATPFVTRDPLPRLREFLHENGADANLSASLLESAPRTRLGRFLGARRLARVFVSALDQMTRERGSSGWIEKTPMHLRYISFMDAVIDSEPRLQYVHVIRRGLATAASLHLASRDWEVPYDLRTCATRWNGDMAESLDRVSSRRDHFVFYEELTARPEATLLRLFESLGLDWQPAVLQSYGSAAATVSTPEEPWKAGIGRPIHTSTASADALSPEQRSELEGHLDPDLYDRLRERAGGGVGPSANAKRT